jgi:hypothetical protein
MPTSRPFAYNTGAGITGTSQYGSIAVGTPTNGFSSTGLQWWMGPSEDSRYVIAHTDLGGRPTAIGVTGYLGFWGSIEKTEASFIELANIIGGQTFANGATAANWLNNNGYWTSYTAVSSVTFSQTFTNGQSPSASVETAWTTFRSQLTGTYTTMSLSNNIGHSITVTDAGVQTIANNLRTATTGTDATVTIGANTWRVAHGCVSGPVTANSIYLTTGPLCSCGGTYTVRPMIKNSNWGGLNGSSCNQPTQTITLTFS